MGSPEQHNFPIGAVRGKKSHSAIVAKAKSRDADAIQAAKQDLPAMRSDMIDTPDDYSDIIPDTDTTNPTLFDPDYQQHKAEPREPRLKISRSLYGFEVQWYEQDFDEN